MAVRDVRDCSIRFSYPEYTEDGTGYLYVDPSNAIPCAVGPDIYMEQSPPSPPTPKTVAKSIAALLFPHPYQSFLAQACAVLGAQYTSPGRELLIRMVHCWCT